MKQLIEHIKTKPHHHKNRIVLFTVVGVVILLLVLWAIIGMPPRQTDGGDVINDLNSDINQNQNAFPDLFPKQ